MTDFFSDLLENEGPTPREIQHAGKTKTVHFRRLTAGERLKLASGQRMTFGDGKRGTMEMDLGDVARNRHLMVQFATVHEDGKQVFKSLAEVQALPDVLIAALSEAADAVNKEDDAAGKS